MAELNVTSELHKTQPADLAHVKAQLHSLLDLSCEMSRGIELVKTCICGVRVARSKFNHLVELADVGDLSGNTPTAEPSAASAIHAASDAVADRLEAGLEAQLLVNSVAATAAEALAALQVSLQLLARHEAAGRLVELTELQRQAADVVDTCKGWGHLSAVMAHLLHLECAQLEHRLTQHFRSEQLTAETLLKARHGARVKR